MIQSNAVYDKFKSILSEMDSWEDLAESQFVKHLGIFLNWAIEDAAFKVERARHEAFIDTALNRSSILAHGEGMEYVPRKPIPAAGKAIISNTGETACTIVREQEFMSDSQTIFTLTETVTIPAGGSVEAVFEQRSKEVVESVVTESKPFYEILLSRELSAQVVRLQVFVAETGSGTPDAKGVPTFTDADFKEWTHDRLLTNAYTNSTIFDEFYHFTDQIGIRFGNGDFGKIVPKDARVRISVVTCDGDIILLKGQTLYPVGEILDDIKQPAAIQAEVSQTIQHGKGQEETEEIRRNLHYAPVYNERLVWDNDYNYFLRRRFPDIVFAVAWGEEEAEKMWGYNVEHINRIWICAYSPSRENAELETAVMQAVRDIPFMCRNFQWQAPEHVQFSLNIRGRVLKDCLLAEARAAVINALQAAYGKESTVRREVVLLHEVYDTIYGTGYFNRDTGAWFEVTITGQPNAVHIYQMVSIDMDNTTLDLQYLPE